MALDGVDEDAKVKRLSDAVIRRKREDHLLGFIHERGNDELGNPRQRRLFPQGVTQLPAAQDRHHQIEQDHSGPDARVQEREGVLGKPIAVTNEDSPGAQLAREAVP